MLAWCVSGILHKEQMVDSPWSIDHGLWTMDYEHKTGPLKSEPILIKVDINLFKHDTSSHGYLQLFLHGYRLIWLSIQEQFSIYPYQNALHNPCIVIL
jgi:hypothetical protein